MPTYLYQVVTKKGVEGEIFEVVQKMSEPALTTHPETGESVVRIPCVPNINAKWTDGSGQMSNKNLDRLGFTKYERSGDGYYEKKAGQGPDAISAD